MKANYFHNIFVSLGLAGLGIALPILLALLIQKVGYEQSGDFLLLLLTTIELFLYFAYRKSSRERNPTKHLIDTIAVAIILLVLLLIWHGLVMHDTYPLARYFEPLAVIAGPILGTYLGNCLYSRKNLTRLV